MNEFDFASTPLLPGLSVIEASAGTGKTYAISHLVPRFILEGQIEHVGELLLVTYTKDAAGELSDRVRRVLERLADPADATDSEPGIRALRERFLTGDCAAARARLDRALLEIDQLAVSTIHSFCQRTLQMEGTLCGLPALPELIPTARDLNDEAIYDLWCEHLSSDEFLSLIATVEGWQLEDDRRFVERYCAQEKVSFIPAASESFLQARAALLATLGEFPSAELRQLLDLYAQVQHWSGAKNQPDERQRRQHFERLAQTPFLPLDASGLAALGAAVDLAGSILKKDAALKEQIVRSPGYAQCQRLRERLETLHWLWQQFCAETASQRVAKKLHDNRQITYDGLISRLRTALRDATTGPQLADRLRARYKIGLIDESQDTDARQFEIFENIFDCGDAGHRLILIGDPKQAIYGFRGADLGTYLKARSQAARSDEPRVFSLTKTYRAPQTLVSAVNAVFAPPGAFLNPGLPFTPASSGLKNDGLVLLRDGQPGAVRLEAWLVPDSQQEAYGSGPRRLDAITTRVADTILDLLGTRYALRDTTKPDSAPAPVVPSDIAVLTSSNREGDAMADALRQRGIPVVRSGSSDVLATEEAGELERLLRAILQPRHAGLRYAALTSRLFGFSCQDIRRIRETPEEDEVWLKRFQDWSLAWEQKGAAALFAEIERAHSIVLCLAQTETGERRAANFRQLTDLLQQVALTEAPRPAHQLRWLSQEIQRATGDTNDETRQTHLESDERAVRIVTMHKSKGLEYKLVFCPFLGSGSPKALEGIQVLRDATGNGADTLFNLALSEGKSPGAHETHLRAYLEERIRLAYVALTRAQVKVWLYGGALGSTYTKANPPMHALDWLLRPDTAKPDLSEPAALQLWRAEAEQPFAEKGPQPGRGTRHAQGLANIVATLSSTDVIALREPPEPTTTPGTYRPQTAQEIAWEIAPTPAIPTPWRITSFSSLTREKHAYGGAAPATAPDSLQPAAQPAPVAAESVANTFLDAPAGAAIGTLVHEFIESWDFSEPAPAKIHEHCVYARVAPRQGTAEELEEKLASLFTSLRLATLPGLGCTFAEACASPAASEWHFHLPIAAGGLTGHKLAEAFATHAAPEHRAYATALLALSDEEIGGFLQGFIDRLVRHEGRWGVIDWKTNRLGPAPADYREERLLQCAMDSHYLLQAHLYLVALRRYLRQLGCDDAPAGAWLVFLRAVEPGSTHGTLHIAPPPALLDALDALFSPASA